jgi:hypothetical protein
MDLRGRQLASGTPSLAEVLAGVMMQVPGAFAASNGAPTSFPHPAATPVDGRALSGCSNGLRVHFTRATMSTRRLPHCPHTSRACQSGTVVSAPYLSAISAGSGST